MVDLAGEQELALLGALALGDVDADAAQPYRRARRIAGDGGRAEAPADLAVGSHDAELGLVSGAFG